MTEYCVQPAWPVTACVKACITTRLGGYSVGAYSTWNLGDHVEDHPQTVMQNRELLRTRLKLPPTVQWLKQVHGMEVVKPVASTPDSDAKEADLHETGDAIFISEPDIAGVVMTADCLPVLFADSQGREVAVAHAGWQGLARGVLEQTLSCFSSPANEIIAWLGPAIALQKFEVGPEVVERFIQKNPVLMGGFLPVPDKTRQTGQRLAHLHWLAFKTLQLAGVEKIYRGFCQHFDQEKAHYSYRASKKTGRFATVIWIKK